MLNQRFLARLHDRFPDFYDRANATAMEDAARILRETGGDLEKALVRARLESAGRVWWPYVRGTMPFTDKEPAMEAFTRLVLTVDHVAGYHPPTMEAARAQVVGVLRQSLDVERLKRVLSREEKAEAAGAAAGVGAVASMTALMAPINTIRGARKYVKFVPVPLRITIAAVVVAALLSVPLIAGYSAAQHAEKDAKNQGPRADEKGAPPKVSGRGRAET